MLKDFVLLVLRVSFTLFNLQGARRIAAGLRLYHLVHLFVKNFFQKIAFSVLFLGFCPLRSVLRELVYVTTTHSLCQALFSDPSRFSLKFISFSAPLNRRSINIPKRHPFVNTFFAKIRIIFLFIHRPHLAYICRQIGCCRRTQIVITL